MKKYALILFFVISAGIVLYSGCDMSGSKSTLKDAYHDYFMIGTALNQFQITGKDQQSLKLTREQFNTITAENAMKWERIHPKPGEYSFSLADSFVEFGMKNNMFIIGHTLVWNSQTPQWVFEDEKGNPIKKEALQDRLKDHIMTVAGRYKGRVHGWDVINEIFDDQGNYRQDNRWYQVLGEDYVEKAFQWAHKADPDAELYYNDYNMWREGKRNAVIKLVQDLQAKGIPVHGIGLQGHWGLDYPPLDELNQCLDLYASTGMKVMITEHEVSILPFPESANIGADISLNIELKEKLNPYANGLPDSMQVVLAKRYTDLFKIFINHKESISRVTFWGVHDGVSWTNYWPIRGRTNYPLLFDRNYEPKLAFYELIKLATMEEK